MAKNYNWRIKRDYYNLINKGIKKFEIRVGYPDIKKVQIKLRKITNDVRIFTLSSLVSNHNLFGKFAQAAFSVTDFICKDYPNHFQWYWTKEIPRVLNGTGEVVICTISDNIAGVAFLKKDGTERKICTFLVLEGYRGKHIATKIFERSFKYLGTNKPLLTISEYKVSMFEPFIKKYNWKLTQTMNKGYYNSTSNELVYNGNLTE